MEKTLIIKTKTEVLETLSESEVLELTDELDAKYGHRKIIKMELIFDENATVSDAMDLGDTDKFTIKQTIATII